MRAGIFGLAIVTFFAGSWVFNLVKLTDCDFESDYKCEILHAVGLIPVAAPITVWFDTDE